MTLIKMTILPVTIFSMAMLIGCTSYTILAPRKGITDRLMNPTGATSNYLSSLDSTRGLFVFSYEVQGKSGGMGGAARIDTMVGVRIWERTFSPKDSNTVHKLEGLELWKKETLLPSLNVSSTARDFIQCTYRRGTIVYGGHLICTVVGNKFYSSMQVIRNDTSYENFLAIQRPNLSAIHIDTVIIRQ